MKKGRALEKLVAYLERHLAPSGTVIVDSPKRLPDKTTGRLREHDVVLTVTSGHHKILVAIECRDRSRPVGVPQIEGFAEKCSETLINMPVIVSPSGFTSTALLKAKALGIKCLSLDQVDVLPWILGDLNFKQIHTSYKHFGFTIIPEEDFPNTPKTFELVGDNEESISLEHLRSILLNAIRHREKDLANLRTGEKTEKFKFFVPNLTIIDKETGISRKVRNINAIVHSETKVIEVPFILQEYKEATSDTSISQIAVAKLDLGFVKGRLVINHKLETGGEVVFIPDSNKSNHRIQTDDG